MKSIESITVGPSRAESKESAKVESVKNCRGSIV